MSSEGPADTDAYPDPATIVAGLDDVSTSSTILEPPDLDAIDSSYFPSLSTDSTPVEGYWVRKPYTYVTIQRDPESNELAYRILEPVLDTDEQYIRNDLADIVRTSLLETDLDPDETTTEEFRRYLDETLAPFADQLPSITRYKIRYYLDRDFTGYAELDPFMRDPAVEDISCDGADLPFYVYLQDYGHTEANREYPEERLTRMVRRLAQEGGRHLSASRPLLTTALPDGSRVQLPLGNDVATRGTNFTIRKFRTEPFTPIDIGDVIHTIAKHVHEQHQLVEERRMQTLPYVVVVSIGVVVFLGIVALLDVFFLERITALEAHSTPTDPAATGELPRPGNIDVTAYRRLLYHATIIQAVGNGFVLGIVVDDRLESGAKYTIGFLAITVLTLTGIGLYH